VAGRHPVVMVVVVVVRKVRMRPATVVVLGDGQRTEVERLLVGGRGCGGSDVARRLPPSGQQTAYPVVLLQDHSSGRGRCGSRLV